MFCIKCGTEMKEGQLFCPKCGNQVEIEDNYGAQAVASAPVADPALAVTSAPVVNPAPAVTSAPVVNPAPVVASAPKPAGINAQKVIAVPNPAAAQAPVANEAQRTSQSSEIKTTYTLIPAGELHEITVIPGQKTVGRAIAQKRPEAMAAQQAPVMPQNNAAPKSKAKKQSSSKAVVIALIVLFILIVIAIASYLILFSGKKSDNEDKADKKQIEETVEDSDEIKDQDEEKDDKDSADKADKKEEKNEKEVEKEVKPAEPGSLLEDFLNSLKEDSIASSEIAKYCEIVDGDREYSFEDDHSGVIDCMAVDLDDDDIDEIVSVEVGDKDDIDIVVYKYSEKKNDVEKIDKKNVRGYDEESDIQIDIFTMEYESQTVIGCYRWACAGETDQESSISLEVWSLEDDELKRIFKEEDVYDINDAASEEFVKWNSEQSIEWDKLFTGEESVVDALSGVKKIVRIYQDMSNVDEAAEKVECGKLYLGGFSEPELEEFSEENSIDANYSGEKKIINADGSDKDTIPVNGSDNIKALDDPEENAKEDESMGVDELENGKKGGMPLN